METPPDNTSWRGDITSYYIPFCEDQIAHHHANIRKLKYASWALVVAGVGLTLLAFVVVRTDARQVSDIFFRLGPMLILAPIPTFQYRMILASRQSLSAYLTWRRVFRSCLDKNSAPAEWLTAAVQHNMDKVAEPR